MRRAALTIAMTTWVAAGPGLAQAAPRAPVETVAGPSVSAPAFAVRYTGSSRTETRYRATPPNPNGAPDLNRAHDSSRLKWVLEFSTPLMIPECAAVDDPCGAVTGVAGATGRTSASGRIDHRHVDGLYDELDATERCSVRARGVQRSGLAARIEVVRDAARDAFNVTAYNPVSEALILLPQTCREHPDGIDRLLDNYFMPGFSFKPGFGPDAWLQSETVTVPTAVWQTSSRVRLRLGPASQARPPKDCGAKFSYERCSTSGRWDGVLTFTRREG